MTQGNINIDLVLNDTDKCIIGTNLLLNCKYFGESQILRGSYFCGDANIKKNNLTDTQISIIPNNLKMLEEEIFYNDTIWASYACHKNLKKIFCFDVPAGGLSTFTYYGVSIPLVQSRYNEYHLLNQILNKLTNDYRGMKIKYNVPNELRENRSLDREQLSTTSHVIIKFNHKRSKIIYHNMIPYVYKCIPCAKDESLQTIKDRITFFLEKVSRKLQQNFKRRKILNDSDVLLLNLYYCKNEIVLFRFGFPDHPLVNMPLDTLIRNTIIEHNSFNNP